VLGSESDDVEIAVSLARLLQAGRSVISSNQALINDPSRGDKGLTGDVVLAAAIEKYTKTSGINPTSLDPTSRKGRLLQAEMASIKEVMDENQSLINEKGSGFKGFIPAVFGRLTNESFGRRAAGLAEMKVTAPPKFIRNAKAKADAWESAVIHDKLASAAWPKDQPFAAMAEANGKPAYRTAAPEYYGASCLSCHGSPQGEIDITGYPKEGGKEGDLGGVISITLYK